MATLGKSISFNSVVLGIFALITASLLAGTYLGTKDRIADAKREVAKRALLEIIPLEQHSNDLLMDTLPVPANFLHTLGLDDEGGDINIARQGDEPIAVIVPAVAPDGYNGDIQLIVGINIDGTLAGVRTISHHETPGLGDKIDLKKSDWILGFNGKSLTNPPPSQWKVKKDKGDFDQFTGATITPRAVVKQVYKTLKYYNEDQVRLLKAARKKPAVTHQTSEEANNG